MTLIGELNFEFAYGACTSYRDLSIFLCFASNDSNDPYTCYTSDRPDGNYERTQYSSYSHKKIRIAASSLNNGSDSLIAVGSYREHCQTELFNIKTGNWTTTQPFPPEYTYKDIKDVIGVAPIIYMNGYFYVFGGETNDCFIRPGIGDWRCNYQSTSSIRKFSLSSWRWSSAGKMTSSRKGHNVIPISSDIVLVAGGTTNKCRLTGTFFECSKQNPKTEYTNYPELFYYSYTDHCT